MRKKLSKHSKSFIWLFSIAFCGTFLTFFLTFTFRAPTFFASRDEYNIVTYRSKAQASYAPELKVVVDTSNWQEYYSKQYNLKFRHDPKWKIRSINDENNYNIIEIDPGLRFDNFRIYISKDDYFALSGVPLTSSQVAGKKALNLDGAVLGVMDNNTYFTFDLGSSLSLKPYFQELINSVSFVSPQ